MQKWQIEVHASAQWLLQYFFIVIAALAVIAALTGLFTRFGKEFRRVLRPCLDRSSSLKVLGMIAVMVLLLLTEIRLNVLNTFTSSGAYTALQKQSAGLFWQAIMMNALILMLRAFNNVVNDFLDQALAIKWSARLNSVLIGRWLDDKNYYRLHSRRDAPDNIDQRIQQDAQDFIASTIEFIRGMLSSVLTTIEFTAVLWALSGILTVFGTDIPKGIVFFVYAAILAATVLAMWIGRPLIRYNYDNERLNGNYRYSLVRLRDHAESIAFYGGEWQEKAKLTQRFAAIIRNRWKIARQSIALSGFNELFTQGMKILPLMLQAPRFFAGQIELGDMQQTLQSFTRLQTSMSFFRNFYGKFTVYRARLERLHGFLESTDIPVRPACNPQRHTDEGSLKLDGLAIYRNNGETLLENIAFAVPRGSSLMIKGPSGCGKTTLMRVLADLWPFGSSGRIDSPGAGSIMFVPQRPYTPQGSLRQVLSYPNGQYGTDELTRALADCRMETYADHLDEVKDWQSAFSPGELQRIAFARVLLAKPRLILLDEATAALDEPTEAHLYRLIRERLPESIIVSIGHRGTLEAFHDRSIYIKQPVVC